MTASADELVDGLKLVTWPEAEKGFLAELSLLPLATVEGAESGAVCPAWGTDGVSIGGSWCRMGVMLIS
jgi:hypothetical protein